MATFVALFVGVVVSGSAKAQDAPMATPVGVATSPVTESKLWIGGILGLSPLGTLEASAQGTTISSDTATGFGIGGVLEYRVTPLISIGAVPNLILNVKSTDDMDSATELDLPLRVALGAEVAPRVRLFGFLAPGYSFLFSPKNTMGNSFTASGFMLGFGGGAGYQVAPKFMVTGELGYQFRFLSTSQSGVDLSLHSNYLTFAVAAIAAID